ncbi:MAG: LPS assembly protein LptD [Moraxellaceae bacterium]|nr:LPS assembly protein LptD [Moraxellaceae bacterium]
MSRRPHALLWLALLSLPCLADTPDLTRLGWMTHADIARLPAADRPVQDATCPGAWVTPIRSGTRIGDPLESEVSIQAEDVIYQAAGTSTLRGRVNISQPGRLIEADNAELTQDRAEGRFSGNILIAEPGLVLTGDQAEFDFASNTARIRRTEFVSAPLNAHGRADEIERSANGLITIARGEYTSCAPENPSWHFVARDIRLDPGTGRGEVRRATLHVQDVPVLYVPYFNFPIDDRRQTGMLVPRFGNTNDGGFDLAVPIYLNIAPDQDATLTPRVLTRRGTMLEAEYRYLLPSLGTGSLIGALLPEDRLYAGNDRKSAAWKHEGRPTENLRIRTDLNYVSDSAYFTDLGTDLNLSNTTHQERTGELIYDRDAWRLTGRVQGYQTIDPQIADIDKPYTRLPQLLLNSTRRVARGLEPGLISELTWFQRKIDDGSGPEINGARLRAEPSLAWRQEESWGFFVPRLKVSSLAYQLEGDGVTGDSFRGVTVPSISLDGGLVFEREHAGLLQTLEPRAFYLRAPYKQQDDLPNFDTANTTFSYAQLFRDSRFSGGDRIDDANQLSLGMTTRLVNAESGEEVIRASAGQILYFRDRNVRLIPGTPVAADASSGLAAEIAAPIGRGWSGAADALWTADLEYTSQYSISLNYLPPDRTRLANIGYNFRRDDPAIGQKPVRQGSLSFVEPLGVKWQFIGLWQYDFRNQESQDALLGVQYESCCWKVRLFDRLFLSDPDDLSPGAMRRRNAFFIELELKGLAGFGSSINSLLGNNVFGYNQLLGNNTP